MAQDLSLDESKNFGYKIVHFIYAKKVKEGLRTLEISSQIHAIGEKSFSNDSTLQCIILPETLTTIEQSAFENCAELQIVEKEEEQKASEPKSNKSENENLDIQYHAFKNCANLHTVVLKVNDNAPLTIEAEAFLGCYNLRTVELHGKCSISDSAFEGCDKDRLCFVCNSDSGVGKYAREHGYRYINV